MRHLLGFLTRLVLVNMLMAGPALAIGIDTSTRFEFTDCASGGSSSQTVTGPKTYVLRFTDEDVWLCWAATCSSGGERFPVGSMLLISFGSGGQVFSCRSSGSTGDAIFTRAN